MKIENFELGQCVRVPTISKAGKIIKIKPRKRETVLEYWTCCGNKRNEVIIPFGLHADVLDTTQVIYGV